MGRRKIEIQPILDERNRTVTFIKRKAGLFKKAHELAVLCSVDVVVLVLGANNTFYEFSSVDPNEMIRHYQNNKNLAHDVKTPADFGNYQRKRFLLIDQDRIPGGYDHSSRVKRRRVSVSSQTSRATNSVGKHKFSPPQNHAVPATHEQLKAGKTISTTSGVRSGSSISSISSSASSSSSSSVRSSMQGNAALSKVQNVKLQQIHLQLLVTARIKCARRHRPWQQQRQRAVSTDLEYPQHMLNTLQGR